VLGEHDLLDLQGWELVELAEEELGIHLELNAPTDAKIAQLLRYALP